jgi:serine/threonine protein kinase
MEEPAEAAAVELGTKLGKYELVKRLSIGGMAEIFLARVMGLPGFQKLVVVKRILPQLAADPQFVDMFLDEARIAATLQHPSIVQTYDVGVVGGNYFIAMEYLHGEDVRSILRTANRQGRRIPLEHVLQIVMALSAGLHYAHEKEDFDGKPLDIVHCDVSPGNLIVTYEGGIKLVDFGIARAAIRAHETRSGTIKGKLGYISPEQARAEKLDRRTDIFAAGVILYELSLCKKLYKGASDYEILHEVVAGKIVPPRKIDPTYDEDLETIVMRALEKRPERRYQTAHDLQMDLEALARKRGLFLSSTGLKQLMGELFGNKLDAWREAQRAGKSLYEAVASYEDEESATKDKWSFGSPKRVPRRRRWLWPLVGAAALAALVGVGGALARRARPVTAPLVSAAVPVPTTSPTPVRELPVAPVPTEAPTTPAATPTGSVEIVTHPHGASILLDGAPSGRRSPARFEQLAGNRDHTVVAQLPGYGEEKKQFSVTTGRRTTVTLQLTRTRGSPARAEVKAPAAAAPAAPAAPVEAAAATGEGTLAIASNPWCSVTIDGVDHGQTPVNIKLPAGRHALTVTNPDYHIKRQFSVTILPNQTVRKKLDFAE